MNYRVLVADGHWLIRCGLRSTLQRVDGHEFVGEAADLDSVVALALELSPDLSLLDAGLPGGGGIEAARQIRARQPDQKLLLLSDIDSSASARDALRAGCDGCVRKDRSEHELLEAVRCVRAGGVYLDADMTRAMVMSDPRPASPPPLGPLDRLSQRELAVFRLIAEGRSNRGAGEYLDLSPKTVEKYRAALMLKLKLRSAIDLRLLAIDLGVVQRPEPAHQAHQALELPKLPL
jgi:DNA-binding NarL/FixJ family response regulator